ASRPSWRRLSPTGPSTTSTPPSNAWARWTCRYRSPPRSRTSRCRRRLPSRQRSRNSSLLPGATEQELDMAIPTYGTMGVDWEQRVDFERLRTQRLDKIKQVLARSEAGSLLLFDMNNVRYVTSTHIGTWAQDKVARYTLLARDSEPILWYFGSAARHHQLYAPWLDGAVRSRPGVSMSRGTISPEMGRAEKVAADI